jgi:hypothetical protein|tara:strand:+ start:2308 stop:2577 length:270 start_codon:yes stop_codon:yes gene_type:complete
MSQYRLFIDIPLGDNEEKAISASHSIMSRFLSDEKSFIDLTPAVEEVNYRLGCDEDRQRSNYLIKNENGHVSNKKSKRVMSGQTVKTDV